MSERSLREFYSRETDNPPKNNPSSPPRRPAASYHFFADGRGSDLPAIPVSSSMEGTSTPHPETFARSDNKSKIKEYQDRLEKLTKFEQGVKNPDFIKEYQDNEGKELTGAIGWILQYRKKISDDIASLQSKREGRTAHENDEEYNAAHEIRRTIIEILDHIISEYKEGRITPHEKYPEVADDLNQAMEAREISTMLKSLHDASCEDTKSKDLNGYIKLLKEGRELYKKHGRPDSKMPDSFLRHLRHNFNKTLRTVYDASEQNSSLTPENKTWLEEQLTALENRAKTKSRFSASA